MTLRRLIRPTLAFAGLGAALAAGVALAHPNRGAAVRCPGGGAMMGGGDQHADMRVFHYLLAHRSEIRRTVTEIPGGVETLTESDVPAVTARIQEHVAAMYRRMKETRPIHIRDPLFAELFRNADKITMQATNTAKGVRVKETSKDPGAAKLIQEHARVVTAFLANGHSEMMRDHPIPRAQD
jgi:uncharacterized protein